MVKKAYREQQAETMQAKRLQERIVRVGACEDKARRARLEADDIAWLMHYFGSDSGCETPFTYEFTIQQREMIEAIRTAIVDGGDQAIAASRGEGKTTLFERLLLKYTLQGSIKFSVLFAATGSAAQDSLDSIKAEVETNEALKADYPEVCDPVRDVASTPQRAHYQQVNGDRHDNGIPFEAAKSKFSWCGQEISFPRVPGSPSAGAIIATRGLDSAVRGVKKKGRRVDVAGIDDPDTEETARSPEQAKKLEDRIDRAIAGLGSQKRRVARVMLTTLQNRNCASARFTDPGQKPSWHGRRFRFLIRKPAREDLWAEYVNIRKQDWTNKEYGTSTTLAHEFYIANREAMEAGADVANPNRYTQGELSALQFYFNEVARIGQDAVSTEYDNDPPDEAADSGLLSPDEISRKVNGYDRGIVPADATHLSAFIDVQGKLLFWCVAAWRADFSGYVVDYGAWPPQRRAYFTLADAVPTISDQIKGGLEAQIFGSLDALTKLLCGREWPRDGGGVVKLTRCLVDANWGDSRDTVYSFCRQSPHTAVLLPTHGKGIKASGSPIHLWPIQQGEKRGVNWVIRRSQKSPIPYGIYDTNYWKSFVHTRLTVETGDRGCLTLFKAEPATHRMLADHLHAEYPVPVEVSGGGRKVNEWQARPNRPDNHWLDCLVGCCVGGSMLGAVLGEHKGRDKRPKMSLQDMAKAAGR